MKLSMDEQRKCFPEMESTPGEDTVKIVDMTTRDLEYYIKLVDKAAGLRGLTPVLEEGLPWGKCYQTASHTTEKSFVKGRVNQCSKFHCCLIFKNSHSHSNLQRPRPPP